MGACGVRAIEPNWMRAERSLRLALASRAIALVGIALAGVLISAPAASAQISVDTPANGASFPRNVASIEFEVVLPSSAEFATIQISNSSATNPDGTLSSPISGAGGIAFGGTYTWDIFDQAAGTYYWVADTSVCVFTPSYSCSTDVSGVQSLVLTSLPTPAPVSPGNGATEAAKPSLTFDFTPNAQTDDTGLEIVFSTSDAVLSDGVLAQPTYTTSDLTSDEGFETNSNVSVAIPSVVDQPGTLYWQPVRINCYDNSTQPCDVAGPVSSVNLTAPGLKLRIGGSTSFHVSNPTITWTVGCNEPCHGTVRINGPSGALGTRSSKFSLAKAGHKTYDFRYRGTGLVALQAGVSAHGSVSLTIVASAHSTDGGGTAHATRRVNVGPEPPPPGPDAGLSFSGSGTENLGPITVPVNSTLVWACVDCMTFNIVSGLDSSDQNIGLLAGSGTTSGTTYVDAGTYPDVQVFADGHWDISFTPAG